MFIVNICWKCYKMVKRNTKKPLENDIITINVGTEEKKNEYSERLKKATENRNRIDIIEDGLLVAEGKNIEQTLLNKKHKQKAIIDNIFNNLLRELAVLKSYNTRLKNINPERYKDLKYDDGYLKLYDGNGNRII